MTNLDCMLKEQNIPLPTKLHRVRAMFCLFVCFVFVVFLVVMCRCKLGHKGG